MRLYTRTLSTTNLTGGERVRWGFCLTKLLFRSSTSMKSKRNFSQALGLRQLAKSVYRASLAASKKEQVPK